MVTVIATKRDKDIIVPEQERMKIFSSEELEQEDNRKEKFYL